MKHTKLFLLCTLLVCSLFAFAESPKHEFRAVWLSAVGVDWPDNKVTSSLSSSQRTAQQNELVAYLDQLVASNVNAIVYHVRPMGDAFYNSTLAPWSHYLTGKRGQSPGYDPLSFAITEAHKRGLEIHAWVNPFRHMTSDVSSVSGASADPIKKNHPDWLLTYDNGSYSGTVLDPGNPEVRDYIVDVVEEIITNYDVDGVIFDDYFYPYGGTTTEDQASQAAHKPASQSVADWRRENIDKTIKGVYDMIQTKEPWVRFGIAPFGVYSSQASAYTKYGVTKPNSGNTADAYNTIYCNTLEWMNGGYVDYVSPQLYWSISSRYTTMSKWWSDMAKHFSDKRTDGKKVHFFSSQSAGEFASTELGNQINYNRQYNLQDAPGSVFFSYDDFIAKGMPAYLKANKFTQKALPPAMDWKEAPILTPPTNLTLSGSTLSWSHSASRFTVYAYTKGADHATAIASSSNLVGIVYGNSINLSSVSGYASKTIAVCPYDRYGNEYTAGIYNGEALTPALSASQTSILLEGKIGQIPQPYVDVTIEGKNLLSAISVASVSSVFTTECLSGWGNIKGGTLRIYLNTSKEVGDYSGYVAVQSGSARVEINITAKINPLVPMITASNTSVSLTGVQGSSRKTYQDVTITAEDLSSDIVIRNTNTAVTYECLSGWNARKGGKLRIHLNTAVSAGSHQGEIVVQSGSTALNIAVDVTLKEPAGNELPQAGTVALSPLWNKSVANGNKPSYIATGNENRSIAYDEDKLYVSVHGNSQFHIIDAATGSLLGTKSLGATGYHAFNLRMTDDGQLLAGNSAVGSSTITVFAVDDVNGGGVSKGTFGCSGRSDYFDVYGEWNGSGYIISYSNTGNAAYVPFANGALVTSGAKTMAAGSGGTSAKAIACDETSFYVHSTGSIPQKYSIETGRVLETFGANKPVTGTSGMATFTLRGSKYLITPANSSGSFDIFNVTNGLSRAERVINATASLGTNSNGAATVDFATYVDGNDAYIYVLAPNNGVAAYKLTFTPDANPTPVIQASATLINFSHDAGVTPLPTQDITIMASALEEDITISSSNGAITFQTLTGWNARTGGTLRLALDTQEIGTHTATITLQSGTTSIAIEVNAFVLDASEPDPELTPDVTYGAVKFYYQGGTLDVPTDNKALWALFMPDYNDYYGLERGGQEITDVATFAPAVIKDFLTNASSSWSWLGNYMISVVSELATTDDGAYWRFTAQGFFNAYASGFHWAQKGDWTTAGQPEAWHPAYIFGHQPTKSGATFLGWYDNARGTGFAYTSLPTSGDVYACWKADVATGVSQVETDAVVVCPTVTGVEIFFEGTENVAIYNVNGMLIANGTGADYFTCSLPQGMYVIRVGSSMHKFVK